jgi:hypothetical protein
MRPYTCLLMSSISECFLFIQALAEGGRILVHGCDGMDQSAAVVTAALMQHYSASLEVEKLRIFYLNCSTVKQICRGGRLDIPTGWGTSSTLHNRVS